MKMSEERKSVVRIAVESSPKKPNLLDTCEDLGWTLDHSEPRHPFMDRVVSIENKLDQLIRSFREANVSGCKTVVLDNADFIQLFKISGKTAQNWRDEGLIKYSQVKGKIFYRAEDVEKLLDRSRR